MTKEPGHEFLARLGKTRLRPGGKEATKWLFEHGAISEETAVLEVACNQGTSTIDLIQTYGCHVTGIDLDVNAVNTAKRRLFNHGLSDKATFCCCDAAELPFDNESFDVVLNEAMLTMIPPSKREIILAEYLRVLKPGGRLLTHDVCLRRENRRLVGKLSQAINLSVYPLTREGWLDLFNQIGFQSPLCQIGNVSLMSVAGMVKDEGLRRMVRIVKNGLKRENRAMFRHMRRIFLSNKKEIRYIVVVSMK